MVHERRHQETCPAREQGMIKVGRKASDEAKDEPMEEEPGAGQPAAGFQITVNPLETRRAGIHCGSICHPFRDQKRETDDFVMIHLVLPLIIWHFEEGQDAWIPNGIRRHWGACGQSCGCCRSANDEDRGSGCEPCEDLWYFKAASRGIRYRVRDYSGLWTRWA